MKKKTLLIASAITLGTLIAPLASCGKQQQTVTPESDVKITKQINGEGASFVTVEYDESIKYELGDELVFSVKVSDSKAKITGVKFNSTNLAISANGMYTGTIKKGENKISIETTYEDNSVKITKTIEGPGADYVKVFFDKSEYEPGDEITFTIQTDKKGVEIDEIFFNNKPLNVRSDNEYTVTLKKGENTIKIVTLFDAPIDPEFEGEAALLLGNEDRNIYPLVKVNGVYESEEIHITDTTRFAVYHKEEDKKVAYSSISVLDEQKTFAGITNNPSGNGGTFSQMNLKIQGGAKYKFYLDLSSSTPLYVVRTEVTSAPTTQEELASLLNSGGFGNSYNNRTDINHIDFYAKTYQLSNGKSYEETSTFDRYKDASITKATLKEDKITKNSLVYRELKDGIFYEVDTLPDFYGADAHQEDYAAKYKIVDKFSDYSKYERTLEQANYLVSSPIRNTDSLGSILYPAFQGFNGKNDGIKITSQATAEGFDTTIYGKKVIEESTGGFKYALISTGTVSFRNDGAVLGTNIVINQYDSDTYDASNNKIKDGMEDKGTLYSKFVTSYTYGVKELSEKPVNDYLTKYFVSSIDNVIIKDKSLAHEGNNIYPDYQIVFGQETSDYIMKLDVSPKTALDVPQYGVISSSDENVIGLMRNSSSTYISKHINTISKVGETTLTIGNHADNKITATTQVKVHDIIKIESLFINDTLNPSINGNYAEPLMAGSHNSAFLQLGSKYEIKIGQSPSNASVSDVMIGESNGSLVDKYQGTKPIATRTFNEFGELILNIDLTQGFDFAALKDITEALTLDVTFTSGNFNISNSNSQMHFKVMPGITREEIFGTWSSTYSNGASTWHSTLIIDDEGITVDCPEAWREFKITGPVVFKEAYVMGQENVKWKFNEGSYQINTRSYNVPVKDGVGDLSFDYFYYNPFKKTLDVRLNYTEWTGGDATTDPIIGFIDGVELLTKVK